MHTTLHAFHFDAPGLMLSSMTSASDGVAESKSTHKPAATTNAQRNANEPTAASCCQASSPAGTHQNSNYHRVPKFSPYGKRACACAQRPGLPQACWLRLARLPCKQGAALTSPARHACGCARPSRARFGNRGSKILSDGSKT